MFETYHLVVQKHNLLSLFDILLVQRSHLLNKDKTSVLLCQSLDQQLAPQYNNEVSCKCVKSLLHRMIQTLQRSFTSCIAQGQHITKFNSRRLSTSMSLIFNHVPQAMTCWLQTRDPKTNPHSSKVKPASLNMQP